MRSSQARVSRLAEVFGVGGYDANTGAGYGRDAEPRGPGKTWQQDALYPYRTDSTTLDDVLADDETEDHDDEFIDAFAVKTGLGRVVTNRLGNRIRDLGSFVDGSSRLDLAHACALDLLPIVAEDNFYTVGSRSSGMQSRVSGTKQGLACPPAPTEWDEAVQAHDDDPDHVWSLEDVAAETEEPRQLQKSRRERAGSGTIE